MTNVTREERVEQFLACAKPPTFEVAWGTFTEELKELHEAAEVFHNVLPDVDVPQATKARVRAEFIKEMADVQYTLSQLAIFYNVDLEEAFNRVADSNMTKVQHGSVQYREDGKILKGDNYVAPDMSKL